ncbi:hypothetical protein DFP72DRAFT_1064281 [Ephemerocybe angulata]|uniref:Uncharacterized protein n=1 Tax=Ephemerocybe angulata TaxID=980116 RepID=A0A8H6HKZ2_9AGAR|nr:hypothetical protein DFP72DRAFT_1077651 [Tulosesus angulatus]KAF6747616.1 hypothetical protein DFP72DRAFT_1075086 [Tulosesus angulatus]KAF6759326.1 hypothetical protein DFP72DRAFT_1064281 [Tulosesus angulatus]
MPYLGIPSALLRLYYIFPSPGAPWSWETWKNITNVRFGLFPEQDDQLPPRLSRAAAAHIHLYFKAYSALSTDAEREVFLRTPYLPGSALWHKWVMKMWSDRNLAAIVKKALGAVDCLPFQIMQAENLQTVPAELPLFLAYDEIAGVLFGAEGRWNGTINPLLRPTVATIASCTAGDLLITANALVSRAKQVEQDIHQALEDLAGGSPTENGTATFINLLIRWRMDVNRWGGQDMQNQLAKFEAELTAIREGLWGIPRRPQLLLAKRSTRIDLYHFQAMAEQEDVDDLLDLLKHYFEPSARSRATTPVLLKSDSD